MTNRYTEYVGFSQSNPEDYIGVVRSSRNLMLTEALFLETIQPSSKEKYTPRYSLKDYDNNGCISAYQIYIHSATEEEAALKLVGSLNHWRKLCNLNWFMNGRTSIGFEGLAQWRKDKAELDRMQATKTLIKKARDGDVSAARLLQKRADEAITEMGGKSKSAKNKKGKSDEDFEFLKDYIGKE